MLIKFVIFALFLNIFSSAPSWALENCKDPQTQTDMNICSDQAYKKSDENLNVTYKKALKILETNIPGQLERFKEAQRAWIKFRDLQCDYVVSNYEGGTIAPLMHTTCMTDLTEERTKQIPSLFEEWE